MSQKIEQIIIVGGGTAGWLSALYLSKSLNGDAPQPPVNITLIESADIGSVGVGEATVPHIKSTFKYLDLDEEALDIKNQHRQLAEYKAAIENMRSSSVKDVELKKYKISLYLGTMNIVIVCSFHIPIQYGVPRLKSTKIRYIV